MTVNWYLFSAYVAVWTLLFIYLVYLNRKQNQVAAELRDVAEAIASNSQRPTSNS